MPVRILGRPWSWWAAAPLEPAHYVALLHVFSASRRPFHDFARYAFRLGSYPYTCRLRTPIGEVQVELASWHDMLTVNEVFWRLDYRAPSMLRTVVDIGSNIGISALYFLTRNETVRCYLAEPDRRNVVRLRKNLAPFSSRYTLSECAVSDTAGTVEFGIESSGRYGGVGLALDDTISVPCRGINELLEEVIATAGPIDLLKIDTEGLEERTIRAIRPELLRQIGVIYLESLEQLGPLHPDSRVLSRRLATWRLVPR